MVLTGNLSSHIPKDKFGLAWFCFVILGTGILLPWNSFISSYDLFNSLYPTFPYQFGVSLANNYANIIFLLISLKFAQRFSFRIRVIGSFLLDFIVLCLIPVIPIFLSEVPTITITLIGVFLTGLCFYVQEVNRIGSASAILFGTIVGIAALFPPQYMGAVMTGNGIAGLTSILLRIITKVALPNSNRGREISSILFYGISAFIIIICIISYFILVNLEISKYCMRDSSSSITTLSSSSPLISGENQTYNSNLDKNTETEPLVVSKTPKESLSLKILFKSLWKEELVVWICFFFTLSLFPGITSLVNSSFSNLSNDWFQIILLSLFMIFDFIGRMLPKWISLFPKKVLWIASLSRIVFFPLFILCAKKIINNNWVAFVTMALFAFTNGHCGTLGMICGTSEVIAEQKEIAGTLMSFFLNFGIFCGSHFALLLLYIVQGSFDLN